MYQSALSRRSAGPLLQSGRSSSGTVNRLQSAITIVRPASITPLTPCRPNEPFVPANQAP